MGRGAEGRGSRKGRELLRVGRALAAGDAGDIEDQGSVFGGAAAEGDVRGSERGEAEQEGRGGEAGAGEWEARGGRASEQRGGFAAVVRAAEAVVHRADGAGECALQHTDGGQARRRA